MGDTPLKIVNPILLINLGIETDKLWNDDKQKEIVLRGIYTYAKSNNFEHNHFEFMAKKFGISIDLYIKLLNEYLKRLPKEAKHSIVKTNGKYKVTRKSKGFLERLYDTLITLDSANKIIDFFKINSCYKISILNEYKNYKSLYLDKEYETLCTNINIYNEYEKRKSQSIFKNEEPKDNKLNIKKSELMMLDNKFSGTSSKSKTPVKTMAQIEKEKKEKTKKALEIVKLVTDSNSYSIIKMLDENNIDRWEFFKKYISNVKEENYTLYKKYILKIKKLIALIVDAIRTPIIEGDSTREFDIIDYYLITDINPERLLELLSNFSPLRGDLKRFYDNYSSAFINNKENQKKIEERVLKNLFSYKMYIGTTDDTKYDEQGNIINGIGRAITNEDMQSFIDFLKLNNIPINTRTIEAMQNRFINGIPSKSKVLTIKPYDRTI